MSGVDKAMQRILARRGEPGVAPLVPHVAGPADEDGGVDIASLPRITLDRQTLRANRVLVDDDSPHSAAYKMLRTKTLQRMRRNGWKTIAVTGTCPAEGKTLTAVNLSLSMARDVNTSTILVDLDLRRPAVVGHLGARPPLGIADYFRGEVSARQTVFRADAGRLGLVLNDRSFNNSSEVLSSPAMARFVETLKAGDDRIVVFDMPPVLAADDVLAFYPFVDAVLLVVCQGTTRLEDLVGAKETLDELNVIGTVLNKSSDDTAPYYYYYSSY